MNINESTIKALLDNCDLQFDDDYECDFGQTVDFPVDTQQAASIQRASAEHLSKPGVNLISESNPDRSVKLDQRVSFPVDTQQAAAIQSISKESLAISGSNLLTVLPPASSSVTDAVVNAQQPSVDQVSVVVQEQTPVKLISIERLALLAFECRKIPAKNPSLSRKELESILTVAQGPFEDRGPINISGKKEKLARSLLIGPVDANGKRKRYLLMTHAKNGGDLLIGAGSFGKVKLAIDLEIGVIKAVKICRKKDVKQEEYDVLLNEVENMEKLSGHENVMQIECSKIQNNKIYIIMDFCSQGDLHSVINNQINPLNPSPYYLKWARELALGLQHIHNQGFVHGDLKLENILIDKNNCLKISDFGLSCRMTDQHKLKELYQRGTEYTLSPERASRDQAYLKRPNLDDIWALGVILARMMGRNRTVPQAVKNLISLIQSKELDKRPSLSQIINNLENLRACFKS